ncbi:transposase [Verrucomicrobiales bacterium]|jgi:hypothetical protein|nr:transposase [Verrucomicrobiales bacterium]
MRSECIARQDYEFVRKGTVSGFMMASPHFGHREVYVSPSGRLTAKDYALAMRHLADEIHPEAKKIIVVQDNLNTHAIESFYAAFEAPEARRLVKRFEFHFTLKHRSWLNIAVIEIAALSRSCLKERIATVETFKVETVAYTSRKNEKAVPINWQFTTDDARTKLWSLYPSI